MVFMFVRGFFFFLLIIELQYAFYAFPFFLKIEFETSELLLLFTCPDNLRSLKK